ncbi:MAG: DUF192 domain-containing protein [Candidatus Micrarchaeaceae archaeon]
MLYKRQKYSTSQLVVNGSTYTAILADTSVKRSIGLMFRNSLGEKECMLFKFPRMGRHEIWMLNMNFPIDILWLGGDKRVVFKVENAEPCKSFFRCRVYSPEEEAHYVVEFPSGTIKKEKIREGDEVSFG